MSRNVSNELIHKTVGLTWPFIDEKYRAVHAYAAQQDDELSLKPGDTVRITNRENDDWWTAENIETGAFGMVPSNVSIVFFFSFVTAICSL